MKVDRKVLQCLFSALRIAIAIKFQAKHLTQQCGDSPCNLSSMPILLLKVSTALFIEAQENSVWTNLERHGANLFHPSLCGERELVFGISDVTLQCPRIMLFQEHLIQSDKVLLLRGFPRRFFKIPSNITTSYQLILTLNHDPLPMPTNLTRLWLCIMSYLANHHIKKAIS